MPLVVGKTSTSALSTTYLNPMEIGFFSVVNKTATAINITVAIVYGSTFDVLHQSPLAAQGTTGCGYMFAGPNKILLPIGAGIFISVTGAVDYVFSLNQLQAPE